MPKTFQTRITRLLEIDRVWGIENAHRLDEFGMAFHDALLAGTGTDIAYSEFNAFALAIALEMVRIGFKQGGGGRNPRASPAVASERFQALDRCRSDP